MMKYGSPIAFRRALEERLKAHSGGDGARLARDRKRVAFDRMLARLIAVAPNNWLLKGGFALELRLADRARTTKDIDLEWCTAEDNLLDTLIDAASHDAGDFFDVSIERSTMTADRLGGSHRFRVVVSLANRHFETFVVDVGTTNQPVTAIESLTTADLLSFAGIEPVTIPAVSLTQQIAEKLHAYTRTYEGGRTSSRTKDLIDLALIADCFVLDAGDLRQAVEMTFAGRGTHDLPQSLPAPPPEWRVPYRQLAQAVGTNGDLGAGHAAASRLLDPILSARVTSGAWDPGESRWTTTPSPR
jgi:predicted nucleotidyltransferase component of viral defense system